MENDNKPSRKKWDLMIGIALILLGSFRIYNRLQEQTEWDFRSMLTLLFIGYGGFLIYRYFQN
ncbi:MULTISPECIES: hypothetical protein [Aquimarina]|uniref:hypothetical protein n=1 Tax=Aquimarina TaxID=290174 RepID=UPI000CDEFEC6|nr:MULTISPECIES: hypothetical protein [Aquimarina]